MSQEFNAILLTANSENKHVINTNTKKEKNRKYKMSVINVGDRVFF